MPLSEQDFVKGVDFTGVLEITAEDLNNLVDLSVPVEDDSSTGKALVLQTTDTDVNVPDVPSAELTIKWKRYLWLRKPFDSTYEMRLYAWNNLALLDPIYGAWIQLFPDIATFNAAIAAADATAQTALTTANNALATANAANTLAVTASTDASDALSQTASTLAVATDANTKSQTALDEANALEAQVVAATTAANAKKDVNAALIPGLLSLQLIRTNQGATAVEWFNVKDTIIRLSETTAISVDAGSAVTGENVRDMNTEDYNTQASVLSTPADSKFTLKAGTYKCSIIVPSSSANHKHQAFLMTNAGAVVLVGTSASTSSTERQVINSIISGVFTIAVDTKLKISDYWSGNETDGLGRAANVNPVGGNEVYTIAEFQKIG